MIVVSKKYYRSLFGVMLLILTSFYISACESSFEPLQENGRYHFSIFGALDHSADTQWVRVMPITDSIYVDDDFPLDAEVTLKRLSTGEITVMKDSLLQYSNSVYAWNFYTTTPIHANESYELNAEASDGRLSSATVTIPPNFPMPTSRYSEANENGTVSIFDVDRIVVAEVSYTMILWIDVKPPPPVTFAISHLDKIYPSGNGADQFYPNDLDELANEFLIDKRLIEIIDRKVLVVSGSAEWPDYADLDEDEKYLPERSTNIVDGLGVLAGIVSKIFTLESCFNEEDGLIDCPVNE
ncbi:MAG: hypothetical protein WD016_01230 [Balneolaceae bacterium]